MDALEMKESFDEYQTENSGMDEASVDKWSRVDANRRGFGRRV
jgi:hypothetical protein